MQLDGSANVTTAPFPRFNLAIARPDRAESACVQSRHLLPLRPLRSLLLRA
jgi:hypothetical protein